MAAPHSTAKKRPAEDDDDDIVPSMASALSPTVKIHVGTGDERKTFTLPRDLLINRCEYFRAVFGGESMEVTKGECELKGDSPNAFCYFVEWLYLGRISTNHESGDFIYDMTSAWILADKILCRDLQNQIIDFFHSHYREDPNDADQRDPLPLLVIRGYEESKIMDLLINVFARLCAKNWEQNKHYLEDLFDNVPGKVSVRFMSYVLERQKLPMSNPLRLNSCNWHEHETGFKGSCAMKGIKHRKIG